MDIYREMTKILTLSAREILDSRNEPTLEVELTTESATGVGSVPSGASTGSHEAHELRDGDMEVHKGRGVLKALHNINDTIAKAVVGKEFDQKTLDAFLCELDGTPDKSVLGANAILGVSIAFARAAAAEKGMPLYAYLGSLDGRSSFTLPQPLFNVLNGGKHAHKGIDVQECMLAPTGFTSMQERVQAAEACVAQLQQLLEAQRYGTAMGDEGGFAPDLKSNDEALDLLVAAIAQAGYTDKIKIALDVAASSLYADGQYTLKAGGTAQTVTKEEMLAWYGSIVKKYPVISIEDGFAEDDFDGFNLLTKELGGTICIVGDDLTVTNTARITLAAQKNAANACIIKPNQVGTVSESIEAVRTARALGWKVFASHRSGETMDAFIADFAAGLSCDYIKAGAPTKKERMVKYDRLIEIEEELSSI